MSLSSPTPCTWASQSEVGPTLEESGKAQHDAHGKGNIGKDTQSALADRSSKGHEVASTDSDPWQSFQVIGSMWECQHEQLLVVIEELVSVAGTVVVMS